MQALSNITTPNITLADIIEVMNAEQPGSAEFRNSKYYGIVNGKYYEIKLTEDIISVEEGKTIQELQNAGGVTYLTSLIQPSMYGYSVTNYNDEGGNQWSVFYNDSNNVYLISNNYIDEDISSYTDASDLVNDMLDDTKWTDYVDENVPNAKAYGGPTKEMLENSYKAKHGEDYILTSSPVDSLYVIEDTTNHASYCLATCEDGGVAAIAEVTKVANEKKLMIKSDISQDITIGYVQPPISPGWVGQWFALSDGTVLWRYLGDADLSVFAPRSSLPC